MSVSLAEVIEAAGYNLETEEDCRWLLSKDSEFQSLLEKAEDVVEAADQAATDEIEAEYQAKFGGEE